MSIAQDSEYLAHLLAHPTEAENLLIASGRADLHDMFMQAIWEDDYNAAELVLELLTPVDPGCWDVT